MIKTICCDISKEWVTDLEFNNTFTQTPLLDGFDVVVEIVSIFVDIMYNWNMYVKIKQPVMSH